MNKNFEILELLENSIKELEGNLKDALSLYQIKELKKIITKAFYEGCCYGTTLSLVKLQEVQSHFETEANTFKL